MVIDDPFVLSSVSAVLQLVNQVAYFIKKYNNDEMNNSLYAVIEKLQDIMIINKKTKTNN